jgi:protein gp37
MAETSKIEWIDSTFNGWIGCQHVSPGCKHCYAEAQNAFRKWSAGGAWGPHAERRRTSAANWKKPRQWNANAARFMREHGHRQRIFSASLSDWLDNQVPPSWRADLCTIIEQTPNLDWLLLTKRIENYAKLAPSHWQEQAPANVWLGITAEDEEHYRRRYPILARIAAPVHFISYEPALAPLGALELPGVARLPDWIICGGESGPHARPMNAKWARDVREQCRALGIVFFFKQQGGNGKDKGGALLDGRLYREFPSAK